jgi:hypothetical protein
MTKAKAQKVPITMGALIQRINRVLKHRDEQLKVARGARVLQEFGDFWILDVNRNMVVDKHVDPEELGRELGVLQPYETVAEEES